MSYDFKALVHVYKEFLRDLIAIETPSENKAAKVIGQNEYAPYLSVGGSDACYTTMAGVPTVCCCGPFGSYQHSTRESINTSSLAPRAELLYETSLLL